MGRSSANQVIATRCATSSEHARHEPSAIDRMKRMPVTRTRFAVYFLTTVIVTTVIYYALSQPPISIEGGHPYDAQEYYTMAAQVAAGEPVSALRPFAYRVALPFLVGTLFPEDIAFGFQSLNLVFSVATLGVLYLFLRSFQLSVPTCLLMLLLFICAPQGPFRFVHFIPSYSDPPALFFIVSLLYLNQVIERLDVRAVLVATFLGLTGVLFREIAICGVMVFAFGQSASLSSRLPFVRIRSWRNLGLCVLPLAACSTTIALLHLGIEGTGGYRYLPQIAGVIELLSRQPDIFILSWFTTFGAIPLVLALAAHRAAAFGEVTEYHSVAIFLIGCILLALFSGFHTDRIVFWSFPAVFLLFGAFLERHPVTTASIEYKLAFFIPLIIGQILAWRVWLPIPDDPRAELFDPGAPPLLLLSAYGEVTLGHVYASTLPSASRLILLGQYLAVMLYFGIVLRLASGRKLRHV